MWIPKEEVLVDSNKDLRAELSRFRDPFLVGREQNWKFNLESHRQVHLWGKNPEHKYLSSRERRKKLVLYKDLRVGERTADLFSACPATCHWLAHVWALKYGCQGPWQRSNCLDGESSAI